MVRHDVPRCRRDERVGDVRERVRQAGWNMAVVLNDAGVALGLLRLDALDREADAPVEHVMDGGPPTIRPSVALEGIEDYFPKDAESVLVTTPDGMLVGALTRTDVQRSAQGTA
jgi:predicted transcriptional regulator